MKKLLFFALAASCAMTAGAQVDGFTLLSDGMDPQKGAIAVGDINDDGKLDVIFSGVNFVTEGHLQQGAIALNNGDGTFTRQTETNVITPGQLAYIALGDIDGDGDLDAIFNGTPHLGGGNSSYGIALNNGQGVFSRADETAYPIIDSYVSCGFADFNNDGLLDYFFFGNMKNHCPIYFQQADGSFVASHESFGGCDFVDPAVNVIDFDNDGDIDIFINGWLNNGSESPMGITGYGNERFSGLFLNDGTGKFVWSKQDNLIDKGYGTGTWGDIDGDGYLDLLLNGDGGTKEGDGNTFRLYKNNNGTLEAVKTFTTYRQIDLGDGSLIFDYDNDGKLDLLIGGWSENDKAQVTHLYLGTDAAAFDFVKNDLVLPGASENSYATGDLNGDNKTDILIMGYSGNYKRNICGYNTNASANASTLPAAPANLNAAVEDNKVTFSWEAPASENGKYGTTYNLSLYNKTTGKWMYNPMANLETGWRKVGGRMGNMFLNKQYTLTLPDGEYEWTVQAINGAYLGGAFAETKTFTVGEDQGTGVDAVAALGADVLVDGRQLTVRGDASRDMTVAVYAVNGAKVQEQAFTGEAQLTLAAQGAFLVEVRAEGLAPYRTKVIAQ